MTAGGTMLALRKEPLLPDPALDRAARRVAPEHAGWSDNGCWSREAR